MITIKDVHAQAVIRGAGKRLAELCLSLSEVVVPGVTTLLIHDWVERELTKRSLISQSKGYHGYRYSCCVSVNHELVHGIPSAKRKVVEGDLVKVDICASWKGYCADMTRCYFVGEVSPRVRDIADAAWASLDAGVAQAVVGGRLSDISSAIQQVVEGRGYGVVRDFCGHGIGRRMHEEPEIPNYGVPGKGPLLKAGMVFALEPMIIDGGYKIEIADDGWTAYAANHGLAAHVEDTVIVTEAGPEVVTRL